MSASTSNGVTVHHLDGDRFAINVRDHTFTVDQPVADGGTDTAPTPTELFVASLASCVAFYARRYLARHQLPTSGLTVMAGYAIEPRPARVADITIDITLPDGVPADRHDALLAVASHCTVHNTLDDPPQVRIAFTAPAVDEAMPEVALHR
jgi:putative redox protein